VLTRLFLLVALVPPGIAQDSRTISLVKGTVSAEEPMAGSHLVVNLIETMSRKALAHCYVGVDGSFEFRDVQPGAYTFELTTPGGDPVHQETMNLSAGANQIEIRLPARKDKAGTVTGTVSVYQLQHPLSAKAKRMFIEAQKASAAGEYLKEIQILRGALNDASAEPYARMNIGAAYVRAGRASLAVPELLEAVRLMPDDAAARTNLAYALLLTGGIDAAEQEGRRAMRIDRNNSKTRWVMGSILLAKGSSVEEGVEDLRFASRELPKARIALAQFYERSGQKEAAVRELREFLPEASGAERVTVEQWLLKLAVK
jgi:tetratricopeptide (TPR) repeat protein